MADDQDGGGGSREVVLYGVPLTIDTARQAWWDRAIAGIWEPATFTTLTAFLDGSGVYVDVGAWVGATVLYGAHRADRVVTFEPDPAALTVLSRNLALNPDLAARVELKNAALGDRTGRASLYNRHPGNSGSSLHSWFGRADEPLQPAFAEVDVVDGLDFLEGIGPEGLRLMKVDIEGGEYELIPYIGPFLQRHRPTLHLSFHPFHVGGSGSPERDHLERLFRTCAVLDVLKTYRHVYVPEATGLIRRRPEVVMQRRLQTQDGVHGPLIFTDEDKGPFIPHTLPEG